VAKLARGTWLPGFAITAVRGWRMVTTYSKASGMDAHQKRPKIYWLTDKRICQWSSRENLTR
jgi:hypothetical protein